MGEWTLRSARQQRLRDQTHTDDEETNREQWQIDAPELPDSAEQREEPEREREAADSDVFQVSDDVNPNQNGRHSKQPCALRHGLPASVGRRSTEALTR
jgi:hypothetical protein